MAAGFEDCSIDFYEVSEAGKLSRLTYCTQMPGAVLQMDWAISGEYIKVGTSNYKTLIYQLPKGNQIHDASINDKVEWNNWTR